MDMGYIGQWRIYEVLSVTVSTRQLLCTTESGNEFIDIYGYRNLCFKG